MLVEVTHRLTGGQAKLRDRGGIARAFCTCSVREVIGESNDITPQNAIACSYTEATKAGTWEWISGS